MKQLARLSLLLIIPIMLGASSCTGTTAAYKQAKTLVSTADVVGEHYYALVREAADAKDAGTLNGSALVKVQAADTKAKPLVITMIKSAKAYTTIEASAKVLETSKNEAELRQAAKDLKDATDTAVVAVAAFVKVFKEK